jgi:hypothetical protein
VQALSGVIARRSLASCISMFASAGAIRNFEEDLFGYGEFARSIARGLVNRFNITEPYVVGIDAAWGMGKTSAANLIERAFDELSREDPSVERRVHVVNFSPWLVSSLDALAISYIGEVTGALDASFGHRLGRDWKSLRKRLLKRFGRLVTASAGSYADYLVPGLGMPVTHASKALLEVSQASTEALGKELRSKLAKVDAGQIVVIVDDIDRLHPEEMRHLLSLITTFGNLPRVAHILLHDRKIVDGAMKTSLGHGTDGGPTYLEKIVQLPAALPTVDPMRLRDFLIRRVRQSLELQQSDEDGLRALWRDILRRILRTPRDVTRLTNAIAATWPAVCDHAELLDFVGIETLRLIKPDVWERLRDQRRVLVGEPDLIIAESSEVPSSIDLAGKEQPHLAVELLIRRLFPLTSPDRADREGIPLRGQRAICSPSSVEVYFQFQPSGVVVGRSYVDNLLRDADRAEFSRRLVIVDRTQLRSLVNDLTDRLTGLPLPPAHIFRAVCDAGDRLIARALAMPPAFHDIELFRDLDELLWDALRLVDSKEREAVVNDAIQSSPSVAFPAIVWQRLNLRAGLRGYETSRPEQLVPTDSIERLGKQLGRRLKDIARQQRLESTPLLGWVLQIWALTGEIDGLEEATNRLLQTDLGLINTLDGLMGHAVSSPGGPYRSVRNDRLKGFDRDQLRSLAFKALQRGDFPIGVADPADVEIARGVLTAFVEAEEK